MNWTEQTIDSLRNWLGKSTSYQEHPIDDDRFYDFLAFVWNDCPRLWDEVQVREFIIKEAKLLHPEWNDSLINDFVPKRCSQGTLILEFLSRAKIQGNTL